MAYVTMKSILSGSITTRHLDIDEDQYELWKLNRTSGLPCKMVQDEFAHLNASDRDFLIMGTTQREWDHMYLEETPTFASHLGEALGSNAC
tara:strand:+ start:587 stop:859 length:273 start_codon:yes stop_codon:yes gene_type:complete